MMAHVRFWPKADIPSCTAHVRVRGKAIASGENADRKREIAFTRDPFMFFGDTLDAVARVARISVRGRNKMTNFIWTRG
jgi:hypothetical protein